MGNINIYLKLKPLVYLEDKIILIMIVIFNMLLISIYLGLLHVCSQVILA